jgi:hypothetical protein
LSRQLSIVSPELRASLIVAQIAEYAFQILFFRRSV